MNFLEAGNLGLFLIASITLIVTPGPDMMYIIARGVGQGRRASLLSAVGVCTGLLFHTLAAAFGLSLLLRTSIAAYWVVKIAGAGYLLYLGVKTLKDKQSFTVTENARPASHAHVYWQGVLSNVLNPKVALFFLAFLPQFVHDTASPVTEQMLLLGAVFALLGLVWLLGVALLVGSLGQWLTARPRLATGIRWASGSVLIALGLRLALPERR